MTFFGSGGSNIGLMLSWRQRDAARGRPREDVHLVASLRRRILIGVSTPYLILGCFAHIHFCMTLRNVCTLAHTARAHFSKMAEALRWRCTSHTRFLLARILYSPYK